MDLENEVEAVAEDISEGGLGFTTRYLIPERAVLEIRFELPDKQLVDRRLRALRVQAEVRYRMEVERRYRIGVQFINLPEDERRFIGRYVQLSQPSGEFE